MSSEFKPISNGRSKTLSKFPVKKILRPLWNVVKYTPLTAVLCISGYLTLDVSVSVSINDRDTVMQRLLALGGLDATPYLTYTKTPPLVIQADKAALKYGVDPLLFRALIQQESGWNPNAVSPVGAAGLTQLMPDTAQTECGLTPDDRFDSEKNLNCGAMYFAAQLKRFGAVDLALAAYNAGPEKVAKLGRIPRLRETQNYVSNIMTAWNGGGV